MKSILISIKPQYVAKILNGEKGIEIRKTMPKCDLPIDVYIYCTKEDNLFKSYIRMGYYTTRSTADDLFYNGKGKVVAKFTLNKIDTYRCRVIGNLKDGFFNTKLYCQLLDNGMANYLGDKELNDILNKAKLTNKELSSYLGNKNKPYGGSCVFCTWHIDNLEIFDRPKELKDFRKYCDKSFYYLSGKCLDCKGYCSDDLEDYCRKSNLVLKRPPQSWQFVELIERHTEKFYF